MNGTQAVWSNNERNVWANKAPTPGFPDQGSQTREQGTIREDNKIASLSQIVSNNKDADMPTYADKCRRMPTNADICRPYADHMPTICRPMPTYADICRPYADICRHMPTYADNRQMPQKYANADICRHMPPLPTYADLQIMSAPVGKCRCRLLGGGA